MSLKYVDHNGAAHDIAGLSPGGNIEYGAVSTRKGTADFGDVPANDSKTFTVTFTEPFDDANYAVDLTLSSYQVYVTVTSKTASGFVLYARNTYGTQLPVTVTWYAFKLYTVAEAEQLASAVDDIEAMIPASASSSNKFATVGDLSTETRSLDRRIDTLEDAVPVGTSISNQLINQTQLTNAIENVEIDVDDALDSTSENPVQNKVITNALQNVEIDVDSAISDTSKNPVQNKVIKAALDKKEDVQFTGTKAEWDALSTEEKKEYKIANITDDVIGGEVADEVADGLMSPVTSNAVADHCKDNMYATAEVKTNKVWINGKPIYRKLWTGLDFGNTIDTWTNISGIPTSDVTNIGDILSAVSRRTSDNMISYNILIRPNAGKTALQYYTKITNLSMVTLILEYTKTTD
jgi:hypothetical protein